MMCGSPCCKRVSAKVVTQPLSALRQSSGVYTLNHDECVLPLRYVQAPPAPTWRTTARRPWSLSTRRPLGTRTSFWPSMAIPARKEHSGTGIGPVTPPAHVRVPFSLGVAVLQPAGRNEWMNRQERFGSDPPGASMRMRALALSFVCPTDGASTTCAEKVPRSIWYVPRSICLPCCWLFASGIPEEEENLSWLDTFSNEQVRCYQRLPMVVGPFYGEFPTEKEEVAWREHHATPLKEFAEVSEPFNGPRHLPCRQPGRPRHFVDPQWLLTRRAHRYPTPGLIVGALSATANCQNRRRSKGKPTSTSKSTSSPEMLGKSSSVCPTNSTPWPWWLAAVDRVPSSGRFSVGSRLPLAAAPFLLGQQPVLHGQCCCHALALSD